MTLELLWIFVKVKIFELGPWILLMYVFYMKRLKPLKHLNTRNGIEDSIKKLDKYIIIVFAFFVTSILIISFVIGGTPFSGGDMLHGRGIDGGEVGKFYVVEHGEYTEISYFRYVISAFFFRLLRMLLPLCFVMHAVLFSIKGSLLRKVNSMNGDS